jgi:hypothetical protein
VEDLIKEQIISDKEIRVDFIDNLEDMIEIIDLEIIIFKDKILVMNDGTFEAEVLVFSGTLENFVNL